MIRRFRNRRSRAFTWIELMVAMFIVALCGTALVALMPMAAKTENMAGDYQQASSLLQHKIDQLRAVGYGRLTYTELKNASIVDVAPTVSPFSWTASDTLTTIWPQATGTIAITDIDTVSKQVVVTLTWSGSSMRQGNGTLTATTLIAKQ